MSWFKIDDGFHCHTKIMEAGTPAVGLYVRCGSWAAQQASDGRVPKSIAKSYGTARMIKALLEVGLWHVEGHDCKSCPEVDAKSYLIHDYLEFNPSRVAIQKERNAKTIRQQRWREGKKKDQVEDAPESDVDADVDASTSRHGDGNPAPARPSPSPSTSFGSTAAAASEPEIRPYDTLADLKRAITDAGLTGVSWNLQASQIERARKVREHVGIALMVQLAVSNVRLKGIPAHASAWLTDWESLEPAAEGVTPITAAKTGPRRGGSRADLPTHEDFNQGRVQVNL